MGFNTQPACSAGGTIASYCRVCDQPIGPYAGYLAIDIYAVNEVERDARNRESAEPRAYTAGEFLDFPHHVRWQALHAGCDPDPDGDEFAIDTRRAPADAGPHRPQTQQTDLRLGP